MRDPGNEVGPNGEMFGHQTMFDGVWSPNISCLDRPLSHTLNK